MTYRTCLIAFSLFLASLEGASATSRVPSSPRHQNLDVVATCTNHEATYYFYAGADNKIQYASVKGYGDNEIECRAGHESGEIVSCKESYETNLLSLYKGGYAVMHYNVDNDSNNDGDKARCSGTYFR